MDDELRFLILSLQSLFEPQNKEESVKTAERDETMAYRSFKDRLYMIGPVDMHNTDDLVAILKNARTAWKLFIHVITKKGSGFPYAERANENIIFKRKSHNTTEFFKIESHMCSSTKPLR